MNNDPNYTYVYVMQHLHDIQLKRRFFYSFSVGYIKTQNGYLITAAVLTGPAKEDASFVAIFNDYDTKEEIKKKIKELRTWIRKKWITTEMETGILECLVSVKELSSFIG